MKARVARWGNSLGIRIPRDVAGGVGLVEGSMVEIATENGRIVIDPGRPRYRLDDLLHGMKPGEMAGIYDWGPDLGREIVDE